KSIPGGVCGLRRRSWWPLPAAGGVRGRRRGRCYARAARGGRPHGQLQLQLRWHHAAADRLAIRPNAPPPPARAPRRRRGERTVAMRTSVVPLFVLLALPWTAHAERRIQLGTYAGVRAEAGVIQELVLLTRGRFQLLAGDSPWRRQGKYEETETRLVLRDS